MPSIDSDAYDDGTGFLGDLADSIERYPYKGKQQFISTLNQELDRRLSDPIEDTSEWVLFTGIDEKTFIRDFLDPLHHDTDTLTTDTTRFSSYDNFNNLLLVGIMSSDPPHAVVAPEFQTLLIETLKPMDLSEAIRTLSGSFTEGPSGRKAPDSSWAPRRVPRGRSKNWPTVVLEVAFTEPQSKLSSDVRYWLHQSQGEVKIVLTLTIDRRKPNILLEKWELLENRTQRIDISMDANKGINIRGGPLVIEFEKLFLRPADSPKETDIMIDTDGFKRLATRIWEEQEFLEMGWL